jgi:hypothetical protein
MGHGDIAHGALYMGSVPIEQVIVEKLFSFELFFPLEVTHFESGNDVVCEVGNK